MGLGCIKNPFLRCPETTPMSLKDQKVEPHG
uniref:Uncharacterized protein n=1 Tax=Rhizophora mucronata TaxID=61149 RepID=A0A2P2QNZ1_RHIMU